MLRMKIVFTGICLLVLCVHTIAQEEINQKSSALMRKVYMDGDTFFLYTFDEFILKEFESKKEKNSYLRLVRDVKKVMPYAKLAAFRLQMMDDNLNQMPTNRAKKKYIKDTEDAIKDEFIKQLKSLTVSQGKLLIKLIHRETGNTTYEILKQYRGSASTLFYGLWAKMYNANIDVKYDPIADHQIEYIIKNANLE